MNWMVQHWFELEVGLLALIILLCGCGLLRLSDWMERRQCNHSIYDYNNKCIRCGKRGRR